VFNYQQINKMETINSIRQFQTKASIWLKQNADHKQMFEIVAKFVVDLGFLLFSALRAINNVFGEMVKEV